MAQGVLSSAQELTALTVEVAETSATGSGIAGVIVASARTEAVVAVGAVHTT